MASSSLPALGTADPALLVPPKMPETGVADSLYYNRETATWRFETDDGAEMEFDAAKGAWVPVLDDDVLKSQQAAYSVAGVDEEAPAAPVLARLNKKRKEPEDYTSSTLNADGTATGPVIKRGKKDAKPAAAPGAPRRSKNTAVYVRGLPPDTTHDELAAAFRKYGVLEEDEAGEPKVKMYARDDGAFSGDALVVYFKEESVPHAILFLDETELRLGQADSRMSVAQADFSNKQEGGGPAGANGDKPRKTIDKKKATRRLTKLQKKLEEWDDEDAFGPAKTEEDDAPTTNKNGRVVVLKYMFTLEELASDVSLLLDLKEDVREECEGLGEVTNVVLYDKEPEGVMTVKFREPLSAQACVLRMNGRFFAGRKVEASLYSGKQRFKRGDAVEDGLDGANDAAEKQRLDDFAKWLMTEGD